MRQSKVDWKNLDPEILKKIHPNLRPKPPRQKKQKIKSVEKQVKISRIEKQLNIAILTEALQKIGIVFFKPGYYEPERKVFIPVRKPEPIIERKVHVPVEKKIIPYEPEKFVRPKAEYSNKSPYGIASDLLNDNF